MDQIETIQPFETVRQILEADNRIELTNFLESLSSHDLVHLISRLSKKEQQKLFTILYPEDAATVMEELPEVQAIDIIEDMERGNAAAIINEMMSDEQADIIMELQDKDAEAILTEMNPEDAESVRKLIKYEYDTAGGLMITEFFRYVESITVKQVVNDLKKNAEKYQNYHVRYIYVVSKKGVFIGVLQMQDLLMAEPDQRLSEIVVKDVMAVNANAPLDEVSDLFDRYDFYGLPVIDNENKLIGVLRRKNVLEAINERVNYEHLETQGIVGGDELRTMPVFLRSRRRLSWLSVNILLNIIAASVIAFFQDTLQAVIALAVFLPIISDMSGCSGNQAVAVSMRELSLGTVKPSEALRVWFQEISVGLINGLVLGILIGIAAYLWKGNIYLGIVAGAALAINTLVAVSLGGTIPLILKKFNVDPALASGPILTTVTDMFGFFLALSFASIAISQLGGI
jgi:magnesium transporter